MTTTDARNAAPALAPVDLLKQAEYAAAALELARIALPTAFVPDGLKVWIDPEKAKGPAATADKSLANVDHDATIAQVGLAIVKGTSLGFSWIDSLEAIVVIGSRPFITAIALRALIQRTPYLRIEVRESTSTRAVVAGWRRDDEGDWGEPQVSTWHIDRAKRARFHGFTWADGLWQKMPENMLLARATAECARLIGADVILGIPYIVEEADAFGQYESEHANGDEPPPGPDSPPALPAGTSGAPRSGGGKRRRPPPPPGSGTDNPNPGGTGPAMAHDDQRTEIQTGLTELGYTKPSDKRGIVNTWLDEARDGDAPHKIERMTDLTMEQAREVLKRIDAERRRRAQDAGNGNGQGRAEDGGDPPAADPGTPAGGDDAAATPGDDAS